MTLSRILPRTAVVGSAVLILLAAASAEARPRRVHRYDHRYVDDYGWNPSVGRNAVPAIAGGLGGMAGGWIDTMANAWADPNFRDADYFDYYRRPYSGSSRATRW